MHERVMAALRLENELRRALERGELRVHYQPIVSLESGRPSTGVWAGSAARGGRPSTGVWAGSAARGGRIVSVEALVRWQHRERGLVPPAEFIALAEETGLIVPLGRWVLEEACKGVLTLPSDVGLSVNLSGRQLLQPDLVEQLSSVLKSTGIDPGRLRLELTESMLIGSGATAVEGLERLRALGVQLCIDDFGTGYSSLSYLHQLPIDALKIDRSFIKAMSADDRKIKIVQSILMLGKGLGIEVIAEGVETEEQVATLRRLGCTRAQGYLFAWPLPLPDIARLLEVR
jgi:Amt family ammonium transporter